MSYIEDLIVPPSGGRLWDAPVNQLVTFASQELVLGKPASDTSYGWCNEYGEMPVSVPSFACSKFLVSNAEFMQFVHSCGYSHKRWWSESGWRWRTEHQVTPEIDLCFPWSFFKSDVVILLEQITNCSVLTGLPPTILDRGSARGCGQRSIPSGAALDR